MNLPPVFAALRKHKAGVVMIAIEIALTLAIVCNAVFIIGQRVARVDLPTGLDESNLILVQQQYVDAPSGSSKASLDKLDAMQLADLAALRRVPGVAMWRQSVRCRSWGADMAGRWRASPVSVQHSAPP